MARKKDNGVILNMLRPITNTVYIHTRMGAISPLRNVLIFLFIGLSNFYQSSANEIGANQNVGLLINASNNTSVKKIPETLFGIFIEEINHAGAGGLWAELVSNRGFEAEGPKTPSTFLPWSVIGDGSSIFVSTDNSSCFDRNKIALRMEVICALEGDDICPTGGVGISNPGYWGMNIEQGKNYKLVLYVRSLGSINMSVSLIGSTQTLATDNLVADNISNWTKMEILLKANGSDANSRLQLTTTKQGIIWIDQVSLMPTDTYKGHGFRNDLFQMLKALKPGFLRFPGGIFVQGYSLMNAFRWKDTIGPWQERPGHFGDVWSYWTDDGLGYFEFLQLAEDLGALPVWVFNNGMSLRDHVKISELSSTYIQDALDGIEFARGDPNAKWGSIRAAMGHEEPFDLRYVAVGNEECGKKNYVENYKQFYSAIKHAYPDIKIISNCDGSSKPLNHPADLYDFHIYKNASSVFEAARMFDRVPRSGPKAFVSEYAVWKTDAGNGSLLAALAEAGFLIGIENNCDVVEMTSYAPMFVNINDEKWLPDAIVFDSSRHYGTPSYWMQHFFRESNGATLLNSSLQANPSSSLIASAVTWKDTQDNKTYLRIKVVNFGNISVTLQISIEGLETNCIQSAGSTKTVLTSNNVMDENSFQLPNKVVPVKSQLNGVSSKMDIALSPHSFTSFDLLINLKNARM